jgi:hypothetical protein
MHRVIITLLSASCLVFLAQIYGNFYHPDIKAQQIHQQAEAKRKNERVVVANWTIARLDDRVAKLKSLCNRAQQIYPQTQAQANFCVGTMRKIEQLVPMARALTADGDPTRLARLIEIVDTFEAETNQPMRILEQILNAH